MPPDIIMCCVKWSPEWSTLATAMQKYSEHVISDALVLARWQIIELIHILFLFWKTRNVSWQPQENDL